MNSLKHNIKPNTMKKVFLFLLLFTGMVKAQIVNIPDVNFKSRLLQANSTIEINKIAQNFSDQWMTIDANSDGEIQVSEAQAVKLLIVPGLYNITDVTGLNSFSNLQSLSFKNNPITTLNLNALTDLESLSITNLFFLETLNINSLGNLITLDVINAPRLISSLNVSNCLKLKTLNLVLTSMKTLDVSGLAELTELNCPFNYLTNLNLNGLTKLTKLNCSNNGITNLTLMGLTNLKELDCSSNQLTNLNGISTQIKKLNCAANLLTNFNINALTNLTEFDCSNNMITAINVNGLSNLSKFNCSGNKITAINIDSLSNLTAFSCGNNKLTTIAISNLTNLLSIDCSGNGELTSVSLSNLTSLEEFKVAGNLNPNANPTDKLTSLSLSGLPNLQKLDCRNGFLTSLDLNGLTNLTELNCSRNQITNLNLNNLPNLQKLDCTANPIETLNASNLTSLLELNCGNGYIIDGQLISKLTSLDVSGCTNLKKIDCSFNVLSSINLTGLINLEELYCDGGGNKLGKLTTLNLNGLVNLKMLSCTNHKLASLNVSNLTNLKYINCSYNDLASLDLSGLLKLEKLFYSYNKLANLNLVNLPSLITLNCSYNQLKTLNVLNLTSLTELSCAFNELTTLNLSGLTNLIELDYSYNKLTLSDISGLSTNLKRLFCASNNLVSLDVSGLTSLESLGCNDNQLTSLDVSSLTNLKFLDCARNQISSLEVSNLVQLENLNCGANLLTSLNTFGLTNLTSLGCEANQLTNLDLFSNFKLQILSYSDNVIPNLDVSFLTYLNALSCSDTQSTVLDVSLLLGLNSLFCNNNLLTTLDVSNSKFLKILDSSNNQLETLFIKNGFNEEILRFNENPNLKYICADDSQLEPVQIQLNDLAMNATVSNSYCTFTPGGNYNKITGITIFDSDKNGCDVTDEVNPFIRLNINDLSENGATVTNIDGTYNFFTNAGKYKVSPNVENPSWFDFSPPTADFTFTDTNNNIATQNFCIEAVGVHQDVEVVLMQTEVARPGFDAPYKIVYKNKGNQMLSGAVTLQFDDNRTDLVLANPIADATGTNTLTWNYEKLMPFESRSIALLLNINSPMEIPAVNNGDILNFTATITPVSGDDLPDDNQFQYEQTVLGSYDPNNIICLEGEKLDPKEIGKYLHYVVNFENTGTFFAENVVVRIEVDTDKYDINTLQMLNTSHPSFTRISGNKVEFIFNKIILAAAVGDPPVGGHGDVLFKIKSRSNLVKDDKVIKHAGIYFDYNFPIITNDAETTFAALSKSGFQLDNSISVYPNPASSKINVKANTDIKEMNLYDLQGRLIETAIGNNKSLDISNKQKGVYFLKVTTEKGSKVEKIVKN